MTGMVFWDVDTQYDFMFSDGKLYVPGAEDILPQLARLSRLARTRGVRVVASVDHHALSDAELSLSPDYRATFPPHCLAGSHGAAKVDATRLVDPMWIDQLPVDAAAAAAHRGEIVFRKQEFDVFSNPNTEAIVAALAPSEIVVYGVAQDVCNRYAIEGLVQRGYKVTAVRDAMRPIRADVGARLLEEWAARGVRIVDTASVVASVAATHSAA
jgi:nicotinamidase/pyrazinamidase